MCVSVDVMCVLCWVFVLCAYLNLNHILFTQSLWFSTNYTLLFLATPTHSTKPERRERILDSSLEHSIRPCVHCHAISNTNSVWIMNAIRIACGPQSSRTRTRTPKPNEILAIEYYSIFSAREPPLDGPTTCILCDRRSSVMERILHTLEVCFYLFSSMIYYLYMIFLQYVCMNTEYIFFKFFQSYRFRSLYRMLSFY